VYVHARMNMVSSAIDLKQGNAMVFDSTQEITVVKIR